MADLSLSLARQLAERQHWLITADQLRQLGVTRSQVDQRLRSRELRALVRGVYLVDADMYDALPPALVWRAALLGHGPKAMLVGRTGARAFGVQGLPPDDAFVEVALVGGLSRVSQSLDLPGGDGDCDRLVVVRQLAVADADAVVIDGMRVRAANWTIVDAALQLDRVHALCVFDSSLYRGLLTARELDDAVASASRRRGCRMLRDVVELADGRAESPLETRVRLACVDGGLAPDDLQYEVEVEPGITVAVADLAWYKRRRRPLLGECDGTEVHSRPKPLYRDRSRGNSLTGLACDTVRFTWEDSLRPAYVQYTVRTALLADAG